MTVGPAAASWLREEVRAFYGTSREATRIEGTVVAYSGSPPRMPGQRKQGERS